MNLTVYKDQDKNAIRFSNILKIKAEVPFGGLGVKYVASGEEVYYANGKKYTVKEGEYIIGNDFTHSVVHIDKSVPVQGLCIDISPQIISEVALYHDVNGSDLREFLLSDQFFVNRYNVKNTSLGYTLNDINTRIKAGAFRNDLHQNELFYSLAESIITDQRFVFDHLSKMSFKKEVTNEEVFRAMLNAKAHMDAHIMDNLSLEELSKQIGISKYHFLRVFKNTFGISPYQYQKRMRLLQARQELMLGHDILETAIRYGYFNVQSFTKAFKSAFGKTPGVIKKSNL
ncbi:MAG: helix-turn-helix transcriptional regulator [Flavobacteriales bacterium]|jgi:AraC-like DNA-binding protein